MSRGARFATLCLTLSSMALLAGCFPSHSGRARSALTSGRYGEAVGEYDAALESEVGKDERRREHLSAQRAEACTKLLAQGIERARALAADESQFEAEAAAWDTIRTRARAWKCGALDQQIADGFALPYSRVLAKEIAKARELMPTDPDRAFADLRRLQGNGQAAFDAASAGGGRDALQAQIQGAAAAARESAEQLASRERVRAKEEVAAGKRWEAFERLSALHRAESDWNLSAATREGIVAEIAEQAAALWPEVEALTAPEGFPKAVALAKHLVESLPAAHGLQGRERELRAKAGAWHLERARQLAMQPAAALLHLELAKAFGADAPGLERVRAQADLSQSVWSFALPKELADRPRTIGHCPSQVHVPACRSGADALDLPGNQPWEALDCSFFVAAALASLPQRTGRPLEVELELDHCAEIDTFKLDNTTTYHSTSNTYTSGPNQRTTETTTYTNYSFKISGGSTMHLLGRLKVRSPSGKVVTLSLHEKDAELRNESIQGTPVDHAIQELRAAQSNEAKKKVISAITAKIVAAANQIGREEAAELAARAEAAQKEGSVDATEAAFAEVVRVASVVPETTARFFAERYGLSASQVSDAFFGRYITFASDRPSAATLPTPSTKPEWPSLQYEPTTAELLELPKAEPLPPLAGRTLYRSKTLVGGGFSQSPFDGRIGVPLFLESADEEFRVQLFAELPIPGGWGFGFVGEYFLFGGDKFHAVAGMNYRQHSADSDQTSRELGATVGLRGSLWKYLAYDATWRPNAVFWLKDKVFGESDVLHPSPLELGLSGTYRGYFLRLGGTYTPGTERKTSYQLTGGVVL